MISVERTGFVSVRPGDVWRALADFALISTWAPNVDHSCLLTEQDAGVGTARRIQTGRMTLVETVTTWTPPTDTTRGVLAYAIAGLPPVVRSVTNSWGLTARTGGTAITLTSTVDAGPRPPHQLIARVVGRKLAAASEEMIDGLAEHITQTDHTTASAHITASGAIS